VNTTRLLTYFKIYIRCQNNSGSALYSGPFYVSVICGPKSVNVFSLNFKEVLVFFYDGKNIPIYKFDNFTTNDTASCSVIKHKIAFESSNIDFIP
jgi:hypothetical protein